MPGEINDIKNSLSFQKLKELDAAFDAQLRLLRNSGDSHRNKSEKSRALAKKWVARLSVLFLLIVLPFLVLIRTSVYIYSAFQFNGWLALTGGIAATILLLLLYVWTVHFYIMNKRRLNKYLVHGTTLLVLAYCCYGLLYLSSMNVKSQEVRSYYRSLHPILRITLVTTTLADQQLVITDTRRRPADYYEMGLPVNENSLHYIQETGYVHAVDIRTRGRAEWKNRITQNIFRIAGLEVIRHIGTEDHLHVFLPLNN